MAKSKSIRVFTEVGRGSYLYLLKPDQGRTYSDNCYKLDFFLPKESFKTSEGKKLADAVLQVGREHFNKPKLTLAEFRNPFKDVDKLSADEKSKLPEQVRTGFIRIRPKSKFAPLIVGPDKSELDVEQVAALKGGDYFRLVIAVFPYQQQGGGVTVGLNAVQFVKAGESFGQGRSAALKMITEMEVPAEDGGIGDEAPAPAKDEEISFD